MSLASHVGRLAASLALALVGCTDDGGGPVGENCPLEDTLADAGGLPVLPARVAQRCNVSGSMGARKFYRLSATLPGTTHVVQLELFDQAGAFGTSPVRTGTFPIDTAYGSCGVCLRALGDKGGATEKEYFGTGGMVTITSIGANGATIAATISDATLGEVDARHAVVSGGCDTELASLAIEGVVMEVGGGGGGGGGGTGSGSCSAIIGD